MTGAIDRVTRFFANSLADSFVEILQNARHSGATRLDVATEAKPSALSAVPMSMWMTMRPKANASATK